MEMLGKVRRMHLRDKLTTRAAALALTRRSIERIVWRRQLGQDHGQIGINGRKRPPTAVYPWGPHDAMIEFGAQIDCVHKFIYGHNNSTSYNQGETRAICKRKANAVLSRMLIC